MSSRLGSGRIKKTLWKDKTRGLWSFICPLCRTQRKVSLRSRPGGIHYFQIALTSMVFTLICWDWLSWKGIVSFLPFWTLFEVIYRWRLRAILPCSQCGFDPYLFLMDAKWAKEEVESHWRRKFAEKGIPYPTPLAPDRNHPGKDHPRN